MKGLLITLVIILSAPMQASAQQWSVVMNPQELARQKDVITEKFPGIFKKEEIIDVRKNDADTYRVSFKHNGAYFEAFVSSERSKRGMLLIETDELLPANKIPEAVKAGLALSNYKAWHINKIFLATTPSSGVLYRVDIFKNEQQKNKIKTLYFDDTGRFHEEPPK